MVELVSGFTQGTKQRVRAISSLRSQSGLECVPGGGNFTISWTAEDLADDYEARHQIAGEEEWTAAPPTQETSETLAQQVRLTRRGSNSP